jgi:transposase-like protein
MNDQENLCCPNKACPDYGLRGGDNIAYRGKYGKNFDKPLFYCRTCGKRFAATQKTPLFGAHLSTEQIHQIIHHAAEGTSVRATSRLLGINHITVNKVIVKVGEYCQKFYHEMMSSLHLTEVQLDELWTFVKKKQLLTKKNSPKDTENTGSGRP